MESFNLFSFFYFLFLNVQNKLRRGKKKKKKKKQASLSSFPAAGSCGQNEKAVAVAGGRDGAS